MLELEKQTKTKEWKFRIWERWKQVQFVSNLTTLLGVCKSNILRKWGFGKKRVYYIETIPIILCYNIHYKIKSETCFYTDSEIKDSYELAKTEFSINFKKHI